MVDLSSKWITDLGLVGEVGERWRSRDLVEQRRDARSRICARQDSPVIGITRCFSSPRVRKNYVKV